MIYRVRDKIHHLNFKDFLENTGVMMEAPKKKKHDIIENPSFWRRNYSLIGAILIIASIFLYILIIMNNKPPVIYPVFTSLNWFSMVITCLIIPTFLLICVRGVIKKHQLPRSDALNSWRDFLISSLLIVVGIVACAYLFLLLLGNGSSSHKDRLRLDNQVYSLVGYHGLESSPDFGRFIVYRCDTIGIFCSRFHSVPYYRNISHPAELTFDAETQEISVIINGEVAETYQLEDR